MNIRDYIGETTEYEKKELLEINKPKSWCKTISAFANGIGGKLIFGVDDNDKIVGLSNIKKDSEIISEIIKTHLNSIPDTKMTFENIDGKDIIILEIFAGNFTPYYYSKDAQLIAYIRVGNESVPATPIKLQELVLRGSGKTYDSLLSNYNFDEMSFTKLKSVYKQRTGISFEDTDFESFGIVNSENKLTNAGALIADESPVRHSRLFCTRWNGLTKASGLIEAIGDREYSGSLINLLQDGMEFVLNHSKKMWYKTNDSRVELPDYPERAVMEGIVNALIHRSYTELGSEVHIDMFDDRLEIYSPGANFCGVEITKDNMLSLPSKRRNPILADIFARLKYMERRGSGFKKIVEDYEMQPNFSDKLRPLVLSLGEDFTLILKNLNYNDVPQGDTQDDTQGDTQDDTQGDTQDDTQKNIDSTILKMIKEDRNVTTEQIAKSLNTSIITIKRHIKNIKCLKYIGSGYSGHWEIVEN